MPEKNLINEYYTAAQQGEAEFQYLIGLCYFFGRGLEPDLDKSLKWMRKAVDQNFAKAEYFVGVLYQETEQYEKAAEMFRKVAEKAVEPITERLLMESE